MNKPNRRVLSFVLAAAMLFSMMTVVMISASAETTQVQISSCDSDEGWYLWPGDKATVDTIVSDFCREGTGSIRYAPHGGGYNFTYVLPETMDFTNAVSLQFEFWANTGDVFSRTGEGKSGIILSSSNAPSGDYQDYYLEPSDEGQNNAGVWCDVESYKSQEPAANSWATVTVPIDWSTQGNEFNPSEVKYIRFYGLEHTGSGHEEYIDDVRVNLAEGSQADERMAKSVDNKISALGEIDLGKEAAVVSARAAYDALTDAQKALVTKLDVLEAAEAALADLLKYNVLIEDGTDLSRWSLVKPTTSSLGYDYYNGHVWMWYQVSHCLTLDNPISVAGASKIKIDLTDSCWDGDCDYNTAEIFARMNEGSQYGLALTSYTGELPNGVCQERFDLNEEAWSTYGVRLVPDEAVDAKMNTFTIDWSSAGESFDPTAMTGLAIVAPEGRSSIIINGIWKVYDAEDVANAEAIDNQIAALGEITIDKEANVAAARAAYNALNDKAKALVKNLSILEAAEDAIKVILQVPAVDVNGKVVSVSANGTTINDIYYAYIGNNNRTIDENWYSFVVKGSKYTQFNGNAGYKKTAETTALDKAGCYAFFITYNDGQKVIRYANIKSDVEATDTPVIVKDGNVVSFECTENIANIYYTYDGENDYEYVNWYAFVIRGRKSGENRGNIGYNAVVPDVAGGNNNGRYISLEKAGHYTFVVNYADGKKVVVKTVVD